MNFPFHVSLALRRLCRSQIVRFVTVGCAAAATHWAVAVACVVLFSAQPLLANVIGWALAFIVSFSGHYGLTFRNQNASFWQAARRFFIVSLAGFLINETVYALGLEYSALRYDVLLAAILVGMAIITYIVARFWAFRSSPTAPGNSPAGKTGIH